MTTCMIFTEPEIGKIKDTIQSDLPSCPAHRRKYGKAMRLYTLKTDNSQMKGCEDYQLMEEGICKTPNSKDL